MYTIAMMENLPGEYKGEVTERFLELSSMHWDRLKKEFEEMDKADKDESDFRKIVKVTYAKKEAENLIKNIEALSDEEKEICEIHKLKHSKGYELIIGPVSERRWLELWHGIKI